MLTLHHVYNSGLVGLSMIVAILASYTALDLSGRIHAATGRARALWLTGGATALGIGIWSMHFVGMLALHLEHPATYSTLPLVTSIGVAIGASGFALWIASRFRVGYPGLATAAVAMGIAIAGMHYIGMAGMQVPLRIEYDASLVSTSIAIAIGASFVALYIARRLRSEESRRVRQLRILAAIAMGFAIAGMHYTGMAAARFIVVDHPALPTDAGLPRVALGVATALAGILVAGLAMIAAMLDRVVRSRTVEATLRAEKEAAERTNRIKSEFLANMSHELRTPLNSIIGFANILLRNKRDALGDQDLSYITRIAANGTHLLELINGVLDVAKIEAGRVEIERTLVDVEQLVRETLGELEPQAEARALRLVADVPSGLAPLETDRSRLRQILINLLGNAIKFTRHGDIVVKVHARLGAVTRIDVVDRGIGIPADRLIVIFDAFQQADASTSREYGGTGLGLTITRSLAQLLGWNVTVASTVGVGSTFSIVIIGTGEGSAETRMRTPAAITTLTAGAAVQPLDHRGPRERIRVLVIDDELDARNILQDQLEELGCEVATAASFDEGMRLAHMLAPDLITLDIMMPRKNGIDALLELKRDVELCSIPVVIVSVVAGEQNRRFVGAADWIDKPVTREALKHVIARNIGTAWSPTKLAG